MRCVLLPAVLLVVSAGAHAQTPEAGHLGGSGDPILLVAPAPRLGVDLPGRERGAELFEPSLEAMTTVGPRGARRGAKIGLLVGLGVSAVVIGAAGLADKRDGCEYVCGWHIATVAAVPFTALTTLTGALIGSVPTRNDPWPASIPVRSPRPSPL